MRNKKIVNQHIFIDIFSTELTGKLQILRKTGKMQKERSQLPVHIENIDSAIIFSYKVFGLGLLISSLFIYLFGVCFPIILVVF